VGKSKKVEKYILGGIMRMVPGGTIEISDEAVGKTASWGNRALLYPGHSVHPSENAMSTKAVFITEE
jgi:hypothetical protein